VAVQPDEHFGVATRAGTLHFLYARLPRTPGSKRRARREWLSRFCARNFKGAAAYQPGTAWTAVSQGAGHQPSIAGSRTGGSDQISSGNQAKHRRKRSRHRESFFTGQSAPSGGGKASVFRNRFDRAGAGSFYGTRRRD